MTVFSSLRLMRCMLKSRLNRRVSLRCLVVFLFAYIIALLLFSHMELIMYFVRLDKSIEGLSGLDPKDKPTCTLPQLNPFDLPIDTSDIPNLTCWEKDPDWVFVDNGTFRISPEASRTHGDIVCEFAPLVRVSDFRLRQTSIIKPMLDGTPIPTDFFQVTCNSASGKQYHSVHAGVAYNKNLHDRQPIKTPNTAMGYNVFMFGFDSMSRMSWYRNLPKTRDYFVNTLGGLELEGYNIVGDGTTQALLPILAGNLEKDLPNARKGEPGSVFVDQFPWIWNDFRKAGYINAFGEDMSNLGAFQYRLNGFKEQPVDHYMRNYFLIAEKMYKLNVAPWCVRATPRHQRFMNYFRDVFKMYQDKPKFMFAFYVEMSHRNNNNLKSIDSDVVEYLQNLQTSGYLDKTILIMMGDHGARFAKHRKTSQGKLEERLPYFAFRFPPEFAEKYPEALKNFNTNRHRLTTPFDIHQTFHQILKYTGARLGSLSDRGIGLFDEIPKDRTCMHAGIEPHWCVCLQWKQVKVTEHHFAAEVVVRYINDATQKVRKKCAYLQLDHVKQVSVVSPNDKVLKFKKSADIHGDIPDLSDTMTGDLEYVMVTLVTTPGHAQFEVTVKHSIPLDTYEVSERGVSRINKYGNDPQCIADKFPHLREFCYCL